MSAAKPLSKYFKDLNLGQWEIVFETAANMAVKSKVDNASLCIVPNDKQVATLIFKTGAIVVLTLGADKMGSVVNASWDNSLLIKQTVETVTGN